jgi:HlyD family secretion protein
MNEKEAKIKSPLARRVSHLAGAVRTKLGAFLRRFAPSLFRAVRPDPHGMVMHQTYFWSRAILWIIVATIILSVVWACFAKMDEVIHAHGKLEPRGSVQDVQSPVGGVIEEVMVKEGNAVTAGQPLLRLDRKVAEVEVNSLTGQLQSLQSERDFYDAVLSGRPQAAPPEGLPSAVANLAKDHAALVAEDKLFRAIIDSSSIDGVLNADQQARLGSEVRNYQEKLNAISQQLEQAREIGKRTGDIWTRFRGLADKKVASEVETMAKEVEHIQALAKVKDLEGQEENLATQFRMDARTRLGENTKRLAQTEAELGRAKLANLQRLAEVESRLAAAKESLTYHTIDSPANGVVFELISSTPGTVVGAKDIVLKIVPSEELIAKVDITNRDIGFVRTGMPAEVEIESFPKLEFGYIDGEMFFVGSDAIPPNEVNPQYTFPAKVSLARQHLVVGGKEIRLQSGMSVNVNLKVRDRRVINFFLDSLIGPIDRMREVR